MMPRARLTARVAALAVVCAVGAPVAIATASAAADGPTVRTPASERADRQGRGACGRGRDVDRSGLSRHQHLAQHDHGPVGLRRRSGHSLRPPGEKPLPGRTAPCCAWAVLEPMIPGGRSPA